MDEEEEEEEDKKGEEEDNSGDEVMLVDREKQVQIDKNASRQLPEYC